MGQMRNLGAERPDWRVGCLQDTQAAFGTPRGCSQGHLELRRSRSGLAVNKTKVPTPRKLCLSGGRQMRSLRTEYIRKNL